MAPRRHSRNDRLQQLITEADWTLQAVARAVNTTAAETGLPTHYDRSAVAHWLSGTRPRGHVPQLLAEAFSRKLHREITPADLGLRQPQQSDTDLVAWDENTDVLAGLTQLTRTDADPTQHSRLRRLVYQQRKLAVPGWQHAADHVRPPAPPFSCSAEPRAGHAGCRMTDLFALAIRGLGGRHARSALIAYLAHDVPTWLRETQSTARHRLQVVTDVVCLAGFTSFDEYAHGLAQRYYHLALRLATRAEDPARYAVALRLLSHQAHYLGHHQAALTLATTALTSTAGRATAHIEAYLHAHAAVCHATLGHHQAARHHLDSARHHLGRATEPPPTLGVGHPAELAHCTAHVRTQRGDGAGAVTALHTALRHYPQTDHYWRALTLAQLVQHHLNRGHLCDAHTAWQRFLKSYPLLHSTRADNAHATLHQRLRRLLHRNRRMLR